MAEKKKGLEATKMATRELASLTLGKKTTGSRRLRKAAKAALTAKKTGVLRKGIKDVAEAGARDPQIRKTGGKMLRAGVLATGTMKLGEGLSKAEKVFRAGKNVLRQQRKAQKRGDIKKSREISELIDDPKFTRRFKNAVRRLIKEEKRQKEKLDFLLKDQGAFMAPFKGKKKLPSKKPDIARGE